MLDRKRVELSMEDIFKVYELMSTLRKLTTTTNEFVDPLSINEMWDELTHLIDKIHNHTFLEFVDKRIATKEFIEKYSGRTINHFKKIYDEDGILKEIIVCPVPTIDYINLTFTISKEELKDLPDGNT